MERVLVLYANPADTDRIRLDKEHRAIDQALLTSCLPTDIVIRRHATTFNDLVTALADTEFSIFHFSGHGSSNGIYLQRF
ncbi:MAG: hypothetical protein DM484_01420 [Candidatus Methylumidiphilus alinenensis]|uniref:CHAT domain-containing protein n=2 Tax=Candidatus Methylumidiphilus alinenensis TaxID=2202197 RepID=A0A2W4TU74_9GAMM|nr:MAG: hypothetical protein DM484_01420 [Candidatus Methylumidiphilus alinenensis]